MYVGDDPADRLQAIAALDVAVVAVHALDEAALLRKAVLGALEGPA